MVSQPASESLRDAISQLPEAASQRLLEACERFETEWPALEIDDMLQGEGQERRLLLLQLMSIDVEMRRRRGEHVQQEQYVARFPDDRHVVAQAFGETALGDDTSDGEEATITTIEPPYRPVRSAKAPLDRDFGAYRLLDVIGQGGAGTVYRAIQKCTERTVALKMLTGFCHTPEIRERFRREANTAASLDHPNILTVYEAGEYRGQPYIAMKYVEGRSLKEMHDDPVHSRQAAVYVRDIARAVENAHANGLLHRDIKPANVLIDETGTVFLTDFGLAKAVDGASELTTTGNILGTPSYMAPEQARGDLSAIEERSDVYALGATLYSLLTGHPPFKAPDIAGTLKQVLESEPIRLRQVNREIDRNIETICLKCLEKDPSGRYASAREVAEDLDRYLAGEPIRARPHSVLERSVRWCRRHQTAAALFAMLLVVIGLSVGLAGVQTVAARRNAALNAEAQNARSLSEARQTKLEYERSLRAAGMQSAARKWNLGTGAKNHDATFKSVPGAIASWDTKWLSRLAGAPLERRASLSDGDWGIVASAINPAERLAVTADAAGLLLLWDLETGRVIKRFTSPRTARWKASNGDDEPGAIEALHHFQKRSPESSPMDWGPCFVDVHWTSDKKFVACSLDGQVAQFDATETEPTTLLEIPHPAVCLAANQENLLVGDLHGDLTLLTSGGKRLATHAAPSPVLSIAWLKSDRVWIAGCADGKVIALDEELNARGKPLQVPSPVWSVATRSEHEPALPAAGDADADADADVNVDVDVDVADGDSLDGSLIAVGCGDNRVRLVKLHEEQLQEEESLAPPEFSRLATGIHHVVLLEDRLYSADDLGRLTLWNLETRQALWSHEVAHGHERERIADVVEQEWKRPLPLPLRRTVVHVQEVRGRRELATAGRDLVLTLWDVTDQVANPATPLSVKVGRQPQIRYDRERPELLWCLDTDGWLWAVDTHRDKLLDRKRAHQGGVAGLAASPLKTGVASIGGDAALKRWTLQKGKIKATRAGHIKHDTPLISVAASPDGKFLAAVDETARLAVWETDSRRRAFLVSLSPTATSAATRPLSGRLAFNKESSLLCAFGPNQAAPIFSVAPFRQLSHEAWISGNGGTAPSWSPRHRGVVIAACDHPKLTVLAADRELSFLERPIMNVNHTCVAMTTTPDERRLIVLEEGGRIAFIEAEHQLQLLEMRNPRKLDSDLSMDLRGISLALAGQGGELEILDAVDAAEETASPESEDSTASWIRRDLLAPVNTTPRVSTRAMTFDQQNRLCLLVTESLPLDFRDEGAVNFLRSDGLKERIEIDATENDRHVAFPMIGLTMGQQGEPLAFIRRRTGKYGGDAWAAQRRGPSDWKFQKLLEGANMGFYPALKVAPDGSLEEFFHFSFSGFLFVHSRPGKDSNGLWESGLIGRVGDGLDLHSRQSKDGSIHFLYRWNPVNSVPTGKVYAEWDGKQLHREPVDPMARVGPLGVSPEGDAVLMHARQGKCKLLRRREGAWEDYCQLPDDAPPRFEFGRDERLYVGPFWGEDSALLLWERVDNQWTLHKIAERFDDQPRFYHLLVDRKGEPVVILGDQGKPFGWLKILRRKSSP